MFKFNGWLGVLDSIYLLKLEVIFSVGNKRVIVVNDYLVNF